MSSDFVMSFVATCLREGLTKEATAELLQRQSVVEACRRSPSFAEGYEKVAALVPGRLRPIFREEFLEKDAGLGDIARSGARAAGQWFSRHPKTTAGLGLGAGAAGTAGVLGFLNRPRIPETPYLPGTFNATQSAQNFETSLDEHSRGIAELNKNIQQSDTRRRVLEDAVATHAPGSAHARAELLKLDAQRNASTAQRDGYLKHLQSNGDHNQKLLDGIIAKQRSLEDAKTSLWRAPQRLFYRLTGRDPSAVYDSRITSMESDASRLATNAKLIAEQKRRLGNGYIGMAERAPSPEQQQARFFSTAR